MLSDVINTLQSALDSVPSDSTSDQEPVGGRDRDGEIDAGQPFDAAVADETESAANYNRLEAQVQS
jgi:hypothetical protein